MRSVSWPAALMRMVLRTMPLTSGTGCSNCAKSMGQRSIFHIPALFPCLSRHPILNSGYFCAGKHGFMGQGGKNAFAWMNDKRPGNDMRGLPVGEQILKNIKFNIIDPEVNQRRSVIAVSTKQGFPRTLTVPIDDQPRTIYLLHSSSDNIPASVAGLLPLYIR